MIASGSFSIKLYTRAVSSSLNQCAKSEVLVRRACIVSKQKLAANALAAVKE